MHEWCGQVWCTWRGHVINVKRGHINALCCFFFFSRFFGPFSGQWSTYIYFLVCQNGRKPAKIKDGSSRARSKMYVFFNAICEQVCWPKRLPKFVHFGGFGFAKSSRRRDPYCYSVFKVLMPQKKSTSSQQEDFWTMTFFFATLTVTRLRLLRKTTQNPRPWQIPRKQRTHKGVRKRQHRRQNTTIRRDISHKTEHWDQE